MSSSSSSSGLCSVETVTAVAIQDKVQTVTAYKTTDGQLFDDKQKAVERELAIQKRNDDPDFNNFAMRHGSGNCPWCRISASHSLGDHKSFGMDPVLGSRESCSDSTSEVLH